jgi:hypothetical protein
MIKQICQFIHLHDTKLEALQAYQEWLDQESTTNDMIEYLQDILGTWKEELTASGPLTDKIKSYYNYLGI